MRYLIGYDIGSSFVKAALLDPETGASLASAASPESEMPILSSAPGFAEQDPESWWKELIQATKKMKALYAFQPDEIIGIGISYQMHGLVCVDKQDRPVRSSIIWCDSRAVDIGNKAFSSLGETFCLSHFLNSPGNFTASKLKWVMDHEPAIYASIHKVMLPGDFIALKLTGTTATTISGLSEGILWDYQEKDIAHSLLDYYGIDSGLLAARVPVFGIQGKLNKEASDLLQIAEGTPVSYRAGDQPNNAWSLNVLKPGEVAATAGTSGVIYGLTDKTVYDAQSRVNSFVHVNHTEQNPRYGVLLCVNGTGILNSWVQKNLFAGESYTSMNSAAARIPIGSDGLFCFPFGNGSERILENQDMGAQLQGLRFSRHGRDHVARAAQEGIAFSLHYGAEILQAMGLSLSTIRAGYANMFLSDIFSSTFSNLTGASVELYNTDGALGAARAAGIGTGYYAGFPEAFRGMECIKRIEPDKRQQEKMNATYSVWKQKLSSLLQ